MSGASWDASFGFERAVSRESQSNTLLETPQVLRKFSHGTSNLGVLTQAVAPALTALLVVT